MSRIITTVRAFVQSEEGTVLVEYTMCGMLMGACLGAVMMVGDVFQGDFGTTGEIINTAVTSG